MENNLNIYERSYAKLQDVAGGVDGIIEIIMILFEFINTFFYEDFTHDTKSFYIILILKKL